MKMMSRQTFLKKYEKYKAEPHKEDAIIWSIQSPSIDDVIFRILVQEESKDYFNHVSITSFLENNQVPADVIRMICYITSDLFTWTFDENVIDYVTDILSKGREYNAYDDIKGMIDNKDFPKSFREKCKSLCKRAEAECYSRYKTRFNFINMLTNKYIRLNKDKADISLNIAKGKTNLIDSLTQLQNKIDETAEKLAEEVKALGEVDINDFVANPVLNLADRISWNQINKVQDDCPEFIRVGVANLAV